MDANRLGLLRRAIRGKDRIRGLDSGRSIMPANWESERQDDLDSDTKIYYSRGQQI